MFSNVWMSSKLSPRLQGHALMTRHSGSANPCPVIDFDAGFNAWMAYAYGLPKGTTVADKFGKPFGKSPPPHTTLTGQVGIVLQIMQRAIAKVCVKAIILACLCTDCVFWLQTLF